MWLVERVARIFGPITELRAQQNWANQCISELILKNNWKPPTDVFFSILLKLVTIKFCPPCFPGTRRSIRLGRRRKNRIPRRKNQIPRDTRKGDEGIRLRLERNNFYLVCGHYSNMLSSIILIVLEKQKTVETWGETEINREESVTLPFSPHPLLVCYLLSFLCTYPD